MNDAPADLIKQGEALIRIENETLQKAALIRRRDMRAVLEAALDELEIVPELAARAFYAIPYENRAKADTTWVKGTGIKGALALMRQWGNASAAAPIVLESEDSATVEGVFIDLESNIRIRREKRVTRYATRYRGGAPQRVRLSDSEWDQAVASATSKALRNAILDGLPDWLIESYFQRAQEIAGNQERISAEGQGETVADTIAKKFGALGVTVEQIEIRLGHPLKRITDEEVGILRGLYNALNASEVSIAEAFGGSSGSQASEGAAVEDILAGGAQQTGGTVKARKGRGNGRRKAARAIKAEVAPEPAQTVAAPAEEPAQTVAVPAPEPEPAQAVAAPVAEAETSAPPAGDIVHETDDPRPISERPDVCSHCERHDNVLAMVGHRQGCPNAEPSSAEATE